MDTTISQSEKNYECQFCKRSFTKEKTLTAHVCEPKRRHQQRDEKHVQIAYIAYKRFYELTQGSSNFKTYEHFAHQARAQTMSTLTNAKISKIFGRA